jgi:hypothetical protein
MKSLLLGFVQVLLVTSSTSTKTSNVRHHSRLYHPVSSLDNGEEIAGGKVTDHVYQTNEVERRTQQDTVSDSLDENTQAALERHDNLPRGSMTFLATAFYQKVKKTTTPLKMLMIHEG